jgi:hypothetical protein
LEECKSLNSFVSMTYIGISYDRAYVEYTYPALIGGRRTIIYWAPLPSLQSNTVAQMKTGTNIWTCTTFRR